MGDTIQRPLTNSLSSIKHIICCIARLHNFCIDERLKNTLMSTTLNTNDTLSTYQLVYMHASAQAEHRAILSEEYPQWSLLAREEIVKSIKQGRDSQVYQTTGFEMPSLSLLW
jgi:hypothetical protein